jgi:hypothetical protein
VLVRGRVPPSAGLSSSSALVVAAALLVSLRPPGQTRSAPRTDVSSYVFIISGACSYWWVGRQVARVVGLAPGPSRPQLAQICADCERSVRHVTRPLRPLHTWRDGKGGGGDGLVGGSWGVRYIGTGGGGMDQSASLLGRRGAALLIDFDPIRARLVTLPPVGGRVANGSNPLYESTVLQDLYPRLGVLKYLSMGLNAADVLGRGHEPRTPTKAPPFPPTLMDSGRPLSLSPVRAACGWWPTRWWRPTRR